MKPPKLNSLAALALCLFGLTASANDIEPTKEKYSVVFAPKPIVLDGDLGEWAGVPVLADPKFAVPKGSGAKGKYVLFEEYAGGTWSGPDDQTSAVQIVYDADNVYFGFVVTDDYHENAANSAWNGDSIQLMIANSDRSAQVALYNYALGGVEGATGDVIVNHEAGPGGTEAVVTRNAVTHKTTYEIKLPKASLGIDKLAGDVKFGLGMAINDGDQATPGQRGWGGLGAHALVFGKSPSETAEITLLKKNDIEPGKEFYTVVRAPKPVVLDGKLDEWTGAPVLADPKFSVPKGSGPNGKYVLFEEYAGGTWSGPDDQTSAVQVIYDADNVYFGFVVTDDYHENAANSAWNGDSIQLMIASADRSTQVALYNYALGGVEGSIGDVIVNHEAGPGGTEAVVTRNAATHKTTYEIKLPMASLGLDSLAGGTQFGLGMAINDGDQATPGQRGWGGLGAHAIVFGKTPSETALFTLSSAKANDIEPGKEFYTASATAKPIVLDGKLEEWGGVPVLADPKFSIPKGSGASGTGKYVLFEEYAGGTWSGPDDQTSAVQVVYDADNVYFGFVVTDDYHENAANSAWNGDSIQLMIASADRQSQVALYNYALGGVEGSIGDVIVNHEAGPGGTEAVVTRDAINHKTTYEIKLPASSLGITPPLTLGTKFGLGMAINDGDQATPGQRGWGGLGAHAIVFGKTPSETALISLGTAATGEDRLFLSAINPDIASFSFRVNDKSSSILKAGTAKLTIDGTVIALTAKPKVGDASDFVATRATPFPVGTHSYAIEAKDTLGNLIKDTGTFIAANVPLLTAAHQATGVNTSKPGFGWRVFQNETGGPATLDEAELALVGKLKDVDGNIVANVADANATGSAVGAGSAAASGTKFEIATLLNLNQTGGDSSGTFFPDDQMPGIPGINGTDDGIAAEILTYVDLPKGVVTLGATVDDGFRAQTGYLGTSEAFLLAEGGSSNFKFFVQDAGIYAFRFVYLEVGGAAHIELFSVNASGEKVLLNDTANGGLKTYRVGVAPTKSTLTISTTIPNGLTGVPLTGVVSDLANKTITADIPASGAAGYLSITPALSLVSVQVQGGTLVIKYQ